MAPNGGNKKKLALVYGNLPTVEEIDQFMLVSGEYDINIITSESVCGYLTQTCRFQNLDCIALPDHDDNPTYLPGLEKVLAGYDIVIIKERLGMYAYQAVKAKWRHKFRLMVWVDNATAFPGDDVVYMRTIREEVANAADAFLVQSDVVRDALLLEGIEEARIVEFAPYIEPRITRSAKARAKAAGVLGLADTDFIIAHFGQIEWEEGLYDMAHALKLLKRHDKTLAERAKVVFCGIGSFSNELRARFVTLGVDRQIVYVAPSREAFDTVLQAADCMYYAANPARDRFEGEPYRIVSAMVHGIPVLAARNPLIEEYVGKHRLDFCSGSADSIARTVKKAAAAKALRTDIAAKNAASRKNSKAKIAKAMLSVFETAMGRSPTVDMLALDHQVAEAESLVYTKQYLAAIDLIESIFQIKDIPVHHRANLYRLIGDSFTKLGDGEQGKVAYTRALEIDPYFAKAHIGLGTVSLTRQAYDMAVIHFQKAVSLAPEDEMANLGLGLAFQGMGEYPESSRWVVKSLEINPENTAAIFTLVQVAHARERYTEAEEALSRYLANHPHDHNMKFTLAAIKHKSGKNGEARALVESILSSDPADDKAIALLKQLGGASQSKASGDAKK